MPQTLEEQYIHLIQQHERIIYKVINLHIDDPEDKKDLFQEILLQAWKSFPGFKGNSSFSTWLYRIALNTVFTYQKRATKTRQAKLTQAIGDTRVSEKQVLHEQLYETIRQLDRVDRTLITLHLDGYKNKEIAEITGMTSNHINVKIHRLKNQIVDQLKKQKDGYQ